MHPKPSHLGATYADQFMDPSVVGAYRHRPPYPAEIFTVLDRLIVDSPRVVLDLGTGTGEIARRLAPYVDRVHAVDPSIGMLAAARHLPGGDYPRITWLRARAEDAALRGPYALVIAGASLHWMEWDIVLPRLREALSPNGILAIVDICELAVPWEQPLHHLIRQFSTNREYRPYDLIEELEQRHLFQRRGQHATAPITFTQPVASYIESFHARNGFSRNRMDRAAAKAFDQAVERLVLPYADNGTVTLHIVGEVTWGVPGGEKHDHG